MSKNWQYCASITSEDKQIFQNALSNQSNYHFEPVAVAKQQNNGINYRYLSVATPNGPDESSHFAMIEIYHPVRGSVYLTGITPLDLEI